MRVTKSRLSGKKTDVFDTLEGQNRRVKKGRESLQEETRPCYSGRKTSNAPILSVTSSLPTLSVTSSLKDNLNLLGIQSLTVRKTFSLRLPLFCVSFQDMLPDFLRIP